MGKVSYSLSPGSILVTGAAGGIGLAVVRAAVEARCKSVLALDRDAEALSRLQDELPGVIPVRWDLNEVAGIPDMISSLASEHGPIRYLVNNAGRWDGGAIENLDDAKWRADFALNVDVPFALIRGLAPVLRAAGGGAIVNISSRNALRSSTGMAAYDASKAALNALTRTAAGEFASWNIRVNAVMPGVVSTPGERATFDDAFAEAYAQLIPMGRYAGSAEIAAAVLFLLSDGAAFITGEALLVDGGQMACQDNVKFRKLLHL
jgi:NAD(P)-dependent dehydrogenase (short-subunit alcohol dehydrogenase family)